MALNRLKLAVGTVTIGLDFENKKILKHFREYFMNHVSEAEPQIAIKIRLTERGGLVSVPNSLFLTKESTKKGFVAGDGLISGEFSRLRKRWHFLVHLLLVKGDYARVFEQILYQAYYSVLKDRDHHLIHSSGVICDGNGYLFVGPSESGKSTVAQMSRQYQVLNDEINIVDLSGPTPMLCSTPFNGLFRDKERGEAPLKGIFILNQAPFHNVESIKGGKAVKPLSDEIIPPIGLNDLLNSRTYLEMMDRALHIADKVPIYRLDFLPDEGFWDVLKEL